MKPSPAVLRALAVVLIVLLVAAVYGQVRRFDFVAWDDNLLVYDNPLYKPPTLEKISAVWRRAYLDLYTPLTYSVWALLAHFSWSQTPYTGPLNTPTNLTPLLFHTANLLLHIANALLVFAVLRCVLPTDGASRRREIAAAAGALIFALHPLQAETVAWVSELKGVLSAFFVLLALWQFLLALHASSTTTRRIFHVVAALCFLLALLAKPAAITAPLLAVVLGAAATRHSVSEVARRLWLWWILAIAGAVIARLAQSTSDFTVPLLWRPFVAGDALAFYGAKLLWPLELSPHYGRTPARLMSHSWAYFTGLPIVLLGFAAWRWRRHETVRCLGQGLCLFAIALLPVLGLATFRYQTNSTVADRYAYLAMLGPALFVARLLMQQSAKSRWKFSGSAALILLLGFLCWRQTAIWADSRTLFEHTLKVNPQSWMALGNLGAQLDAEGNYEVAKQLYEKAIAIEASNTDTLNNLGLALAARGDFAAAENAFRKAVTLDKNYGNGWINLANTLSVQGRANEAIDAYKKAQASLPFSPEAFSNCGLAFAVTKRPREAIAQYQKALRLAPDDAQTWHNLGLAQANLKEYADARQAFEKAAQLKPDYWETRHALGMVLLMQGRTPEAQACWRALLKDNPTFKPAQQQLEALQRKQKP